MSFGALVKDSMYGIAGLFPQPRNAAVNLNYHSISGAEHFGAVTSENFADQMRALKEGNFNVISLARLAEHRRSGRIPPKTVCITFDDGYRDNYAVAFPILKKYSLPATIFVITNGIGGTWEMRGETFDMLSEDQIKELSSSGLIAIEPHTASHPKLHQIPVDEVEREIRTSKEKLESLTGVPCRHFAYPKGRHNEAIRAAAERAGISFAYTTQEGLVHPGDIDLALNRNGVNRTVTLREFVGTARFGRLSKARLRSHLGL